MGTRSIFLDPAEVNWDRFRGNNHHRVKPTNCVYGGAVDFAEHVGKPLSNDLWADLFHRLCIRGLCVYGHGDAQWTIGWGPGHCCIQLDEKDCVRNVDFNPWPRPPEKNAEDQLEWELPSVKIDGPIVYVNFPQRKTP